MYPFDSLSQNSLVPPSELLLKMFGSTTTSGQSPNSPFGFPSVLGQNNNAGSNPFTSKPFGSTTPSGSPPTGGSVFGGTSTGVFGANTSTPGLTPTFGVSSTPGFGTPSSSFGGSSIFGQNPAFGGFTSSPNKSNSFVSTFQQTQTTFGTSPFGSSVSSLGASAQNAYSAANAPDKEAPLPFGNESTPAFGSLSASTFGSTASAFAGSSAPAFGFGAGGSFGPSNTLGASNNSFLGVSSTSAFGASSSPAFSASRFGFGASPTFGQSTSASGNSSLIGTAQSVFRSQSSPFGAPSIMPTNGTTPLGLSTFGVQHGGSRLASYAATKVEDGDSRTRPVTVKLQSISAMPINKDKGHEEFRWEDYRLGDKGGLHRVGQSVGGLGIGGSSTLSNSFFRSPTLAQSSSLNSSNPFAPRTSSNQFTPRTSSNPFAPPTSSNPFASPTSSNPFAPQAPSNPFATHSAVNPFAPKATFPSSSGFVASSVPAFNSSLFNPLTSANPSMATSSSTPSPFITAASCSTCSPLVTASAPIAAPHLSPSISPVSGQLSSIRFIGSNSALGTAAGHISGLSSANTQSFSTSESVAPSFMQTNALLAPNPLFGPSVAQPNVNAPSTGSQLGGNLFSSTAPLLSLSTSAGFNQTTPSFSSPLEPTQTAQTTGAFATSNIPKSSAGLGSFVGITGVLGHNTFSQPSATQSTVNVQPVDRGSPFGDLPSMPHLSIGQSGSTPSIRYGISSMPVRDKPAAAPVRLSSFLTSRRLSQRRIMLPVRKYNPKNDGLKVSFFDNDKEMLTIPKADARFVPRENPRDLVILPAEQRPQRSNKDKMSPPVHASLHAYKNGDLAENSTDKEGDSSIKSNHKSNNTGNNNFSLKGALDMRVTGSEADEAAILKEHVAADVEALIPQLRHSEYYTEPQIKDLAAKEKAQPGFCRHVKDFVVGRHGYGYIKFLEETDVRQLDLDSFVQFNNREVIVYMDESKKPPVGEGLNKPAEVTLLNIRCIDKKTGKQYINGPKVDKYREMLIKKAAEQGAEFVSYDPVQGEWKFKVQHFSRYEFTDDSK